MKSTHNSISLFNRYKLDKNDPYTSPNDEEIWEGEENQTSQTTLVNNQP